MTRSLIVTGAAAGLGLAIAEAAGSAGYRVGLVDVDESVVSAAKALEGPTGTAVHGASAYVASITDAAAIERLLDDFGTPDVWVNNAGVVRFGPLLDLELDDWRHVLDVNVTGCFVCGRAAARRMAAADGGAIVNITSMNGIAPGPNAGAYGASKAAIALLTQQMALEWGEAGVRVNAVAPGLIDAGMSEPIYAHTPTREAREGKVPLGRLGTAADVTAAVLFLASDAAGYITGQNLLVDGGVTMSMIANLPRPLEVDGVGGADDPGGGT